MVETPVRSSVVRRVRHRLGPWLNQCVRVVGQPTTQVYPAGYVGTVDLPIADFEEKLLDSGFAWDPLSMYHYTPEGNDTDGSWVYRESWFADRQLHVILIDGGTEATEVYAHEEYNWARHPVEHAREADINRHEGSAEMRRWLEARGIIYARDSRVRRKIRHNVRRARKQVTEGLFDRPSPGTLR